MNILQASGERAAEVMASFSRPWHFAGGWAIDLHLGRWRREHKDADIAIAYEDQLACREFLAPRAMCKVVDRRLVPWDGETLHPPLFQFFASDGDRASIEFLLETRTAEEWIYRREPTIRLPIRDALLEADGIPYLAPVVVLLFKSTAHAEPTNILDFEDTLGALTERERTWLIHALGPTHPWRERLAAISGPGA
jgi:hypothetical protein